MSAIEQSATRWWKTRFAFVLMCFVAIGLVLIVIDHWYHVLGGWPLLFLLVCPLIHVLLHGGHGKHRHGAGPTKAP